MSEVRVFVGGDRFGPFDAEPASTPEAMSAAAGSLRLAWDADRAGLVALVALTAAGTAAELATLSSGRAVLQAVLDRRDLRTQAPRLALLGALGVLAAGGESAGRALQSRVAEAVRVRAEGTVLDVVAAMELADVEDPEVQDRIQKALGGAGRQAEVLRRTLSLPQAAAGLVTGVLSAGPGDRALVPLAFGGAVAQWAVLARTEDPGRMYGRRSRHMREAMTLRHYLTGTQAAHELRAFGAGPALRQRHDELAAGWAREQNEANRRNARRSMVSRLAARAASGPAAGRLVLGLANRRTSVSDALTDGIAARRINGGFQRVVNELSGVRRMASSAADYRDFLGEAPTPVNGKGPSPQFERIVARGLSFTYRGGSRPVLTGVDLEIGRGEVVALVGENGSGKTTLAKLLCCLYRPTSGTLRWDDVDLAACDPAAVRAHIAVVFQDFVRYPSLTAAENIGIGLPSRLHDRPAIVAAARQAGAHDLISSLPDEYDTKLSRGFSGVDLSTGQWQRVALARAFLRDAPLVVLDEPTAALDPRAERDLFETVASLYRSRSALLISHRLSSVRFADRICVLAGGRIIETGSHEQLVDAGGTYAELFDMQARAYR
ncbi:MAG TPA: ABC transporter ATP-binding protein [Acidimicrobiales bacterium]